MCDILYVPEVTSLWVDVCSVITMCEKLDPQWHMATVRTPYRTTCTVTELK